MNLKKFSVENYKVFKKRFTIEFSNDSIVILTGRNNTGKSTILEAINSFFQKPTKANAISFDCFSNKNEDIILEAEFISSDNENITIIKKYKIDSAPKYYDIENKEINARHSLKPSLDEVLENKPFYITPAMLPEDINDLIHSIYTDVLKNNLEKIENNDINIDEADLVNEYNQLKKSLPQFLNKLKTSTDKVLQNVSDSVTDNLRDLFSNEHLTLNVEGGESTGFSSTDILKSTSSNVYIDSNIQSQMPLENQGTGLQRMSLIFLIQNMIEKKLLGNNDNKLLLIDEPEAFLYPEAVRALSRSLYKIGEKMPLIISTHSPVLIDLSQKHTSIQVFRVGEFKPIELYKSEKEKFDDNDIQNMKILNYVDSYVNEFFFADKVVIVEGDTEYIAFKHFAKEKNKNIHIIRARGKGTIVTLMKILNQFNTDYDVLHDVDNRDHFSLKTLKAQLTNCKNILKQKGNDSNIRIFSSISNFENAIGMNDVPNYKKTQTIYEILHPSGTDQYEEQRKRIETLFEIIVSRNNENSFDLPSGFQQINHEADYENFFSELIKQKEFEKEENMITTN